MGGPKKPDAVFRVGTQAISVVPMPGKGGETRHILVDVIDAKRTYVAVRPVNPDDHLRSDRTDYHMQTGQVRNRDKFGNYPPRLITVAEHEISQREHEARIYLEANGVWTHELRGFWKAQGAVRLASVLRKAEELTKHVEGENGS